MNQKPPNFQNYNVPFNRMPYSSNSNRFLPNQTYNSNSNEIRHCFTDNRSNTNSSNLIQNGTFHNNFRRNQLPVERNCVPIRNLHPVQFMRPDTVRPDVYPPGTRPCRPMPPPNFQNAATNAPLNSVPTRNLRPVQFMHPDTVHTDVYPPGTRPCRPMPPPNFQNAVPNVPNIQNAVPNIPNIQNTAPNVPYSNFGRSFTICSNSNFSSPNLDSSHAPNYQSPPRFPHCSAPVNHDVKDQYTSYQNQEAVNLPSKPVSMMTVRPALPIPLHLPPPVLPNTNVTKHVLSESTYGNLEEKLKHFLSKFFIEENKQKFNQLTVAEFRSSLKLALSLLNTIVQQKHALTQVLDSNEDTWNTKLKNCQVLKDQLSKVCNLLSSSNVSYIIQKLKIIKKKRKRRKTTKENILNKRKEAAKHREDLHSEIDKWLESVKEKNLKLKREIEMKKEADIILLEVRRKIHETKRTIEKIKALEKLRNTREITSAQKGLHIHPEITKNFLKKISAMRETLLNQLSGYEDEERALKVMLETEKEGQLEEEAKWRLKKLQTIQQKKQKHIYECLFGESDEPDPSDPLYLFYKHHDSANNSIENLVQIRQQWDRYLSNDGESIPQQWVTPAPPSTPSWNLLIEI